MNIAMCREDCRYVAGSSMRAHWRIGRVPVEQLQGVEVSVLWHTEGKGDEDLSVIHFERHERSDLIRLGLADSRPLQCILPAAPLSYRGHLMRIEWAVRVRVFLTDGRDIATEHPFLVVARPAVVAASETESEGVAVDACVETESFGLLRGLLGGKRFARPFTRGVKQ